MMLMDLQWQGLEYRMINNVVPAVKSWLIIGQRLKL